MSETWQAGYMSGQQHPCQVSNVHVIWVQNHLHFKLFRELDYLGVFATVMKRALLKKGPLVTIANTGHCTCGNQKTFPE